MLTGSARGDADLITRHTIAESRHALQILVAEHNVVNQEVATALLVKRGHHVDVVGNGREAVEAVAARSYDVVLMDILMPELDGFAATERIRATPDGGTLPIISLTAHAPSGERERCLARSMSDYLATPFKAHELFAAVERGAARTPAPAAVAIAAFRAARQEAGAAAAGDGILDTFVKHAGSHVEELERATTAGNVDPIARAAHAFGAAGAIGAPGLAGALRALEQAGHGGTIEQMRDEWQGARREAEAVVAYLRTARSVQASRG